MSSQFIKGAIGDIAFSPDTRYLAVATSAGIEILDAQTLNEVNFIKLANGCHSVAFSPDGKMLTGSEGRREDGQNGDVIFGDVATAQIIDKMERYGWLRLGFSPDGQILAGWGGTDGGIYLWDTQTKERIGSLRAGDPNYNPTRSVDFSPDGKLLAAGEEHERLVRIWDMETKEAIAFITHRRVYSVRFSPDGKFLASASSRGEVSRRFDKLRPFGNFWIAEIEKPTVKLWDIESGRVETLDIILDSAGVRVDFSTDGQTLFLALDNGLIHLWDVQSNRLADTLKGPGDSIISISVSSDGRSLAVARKGGVTLFDLQVKQLISERSEYENRIIMPHS